MMNLLLTFMTVANLSHAVDKNFSDKKRQVELTVSCRTVTVKPDATSLYNSVTCYQDKFSIKMSTKEQAGMAYWFNTLRGVQKIWSCDGKEYQLKSYHAYTPHFVCAKIKDADNNEETRLIFFNKEKKGFKISSIYKPIDWAK